MNIINITPENASGHGFFCIKNTREPGYEAKYNWFSRRFEEGLRFKLLIAEDGRQAGFIEYLPAKYAWRPVEADGYMFIHCIMINPNKYKNSGAATQLINACIEDAKKEGFRGVCTMTSKGPWIASHQVFEKNGFRQIDRRGRFALMAMEFENRGKARGQSRGSGVHLLNWEERLPAFQGWHLLYANQCPWHVKSVEAMVDVAGTKGIDLKVKEIKTADQAKASPSGFGVFALIYNGKLLEDHYLSSRRFETILEKELK